MSKIAGSPYPGSRAFEQADQAIFFGRDTDIAAIVGLWMTNRLTLVPGPVASGKTSLLNAGVCSAMPVKRSQILPVGNLFHNLTFPFPALADHDPLTLSLLTSWSPEDLPTRLAGLSISDFIRRFTRGDGRVTYAAIDQFDDIVLDPRDGTQATWRQRFLSDLTQAMVDHPRLHLLLVIRSEALALLPKSFRGGARHPIGGLTTQGAVDALIQPAKAVNRFFTKEAAYSLIDGLSTASAAGPAATGSIEPSLLQAVCQQLWERLPPSITQISDAVIREFSDADAALAAFCGNVIGEVAMLHGIEPKPLRSWLVDNFVTRGGVQEDSRAMADLPKAVPRSLVDRHLLTYEIDRSVCYYRLLSSRLDEPLRETRVGFSAAPATADYLRAAERELTLGDRDLAWTHGERAYRAASSLRESAQVESLLGNVSLLDNMEDESDKPGEALAHYRRAAELLQAAGDAAAAAPQLAAVGQRLLAEDKPTDALTQLRAAVERMPKDLGLHTLLARALWELGDGRGAVAILNWVLTVDGGYAKARRARGEILADLGEGSSAMLDLDRTAAGHPSAMAARGLALAELGDHAAAAKEISVAMKKARRNGRVLFYAARASDLADDKSSARERAKEAIDAKDPRLSEAHKRAAQKLVSPSIAPRQAYPRRS